jgi:2-phosphosulfolactate phosphatase
MPDTSAVSRSGDQARYLATWQLDQVIGPAVAVDVVRAFTTAAFAFAAGASRIWLVDSVPAALALVAANPTWLAMGEDRGIRPDGFALSNSPVLAGQADLNGRTLVQRTSAGTRGAVAAARAGASPVLCASLVVASATAGMLRDGPAPTYVITGRFADAPSTTGDEDQATARYLEALRRARPPGSLTREQVVRAVLDSSDADATTRLGPGDAHPGDLSACVDVDRFDFAMLAQPGEHGLALHSVAP